eukprot:14072131-Alexandrium_andersonii.AAC.1
MIEDLRQEWRKQEYAKVKQNTHLKFGDAWRLTGKMWTNLPYPAKALMAATQMLKESRGDMGKHWERMEALKVLDLEKRPWTAKSQ